MMHRGEMYFGSYLIEGGKKKEPRAFLLPGLPSVCITMVPVKAESRLCL